MFWCITPWNTWLTCEESAEKVNDKQSKDHGYAFEVPADATPMVKAVPLKAMGRFNREAACIDPRTGIVYMTEDRGTSLPWYLAYTTSIYGLMRSKYSLLINTLNITVTFLAFFLTGFSLHKLNKFNNICHIFILNKAILAISMDIALIINA